MPVNTLSVQRSQYDPQYGTFDVTLMNGHLWRYIGVPPELAIPADGVELDDHVRLFIAGKFPAHRVK